MTEENMFKIDSTTEESTPSRFVLIDKEEDFIQDNVYIKSLELDPKEQRYFQINAEKNGQQMQTQRQYFPDIKTSQSEETFKKAVSIKKGLLTSLLRKFKGEDTEINARGWVDLVNKIEEACKPAYSTTPLRVKLELAEKDGKYYTNISTFAPFESMTVPRSESTLKVTAKDKQMLRNKIQEEKVTPDSDIPAPANKDEAPF